MAVRSSRLVNLDGLKERIGSTLNIVDVLQRIVGADPQPAGSQYKCHCPLPDHDDRTPSFFVNPSKGTLGVFYCWGCKTGGDSISLVCRTRHVEFREALHLLAAEAQIDISDFERPLTDEEQRESALRSWMDDFLASGTEMYLNKLNRGDQMRLADPDLVKEFGIAWSERPPDGVPPGVSDLHRRELFDRMVLLPYRTAAGRLCGMKARELNSKRMFGTSADFPLAEPTLFGLQVARKHIQDGKLCVVEGEYDTLACHAAAYKDVVGLGGSAFSEHHMEMLENLAVKEITFCLDGDMAGRGAAHSIAERWWRSPVRVRLTVLPEDTDPEDLLSTPSGQADFLLARVGARHALEYLMWEEWTRLPRPSLSDKLDYVGWVQERFGADLSRTEENLVCVELGKWLNVPETEILDFVRAHKSSLQATDSERVVLGRCLRDKRYFVELRKRLAAADFYMVRHQRTWQLLEKLLADGLEFDLATVSQRAIVHGVPDDYVAGLSEVSEVNVGWHEEVVADLSVRRDARDSVARFSEQIADLSRDSQALIGELTHNVSERSLGRGSAALQPVALQVDEAMEILHERIRNPSAIHGLDLGGQLPATSRSLQGLQRKRLVLVAASSGIGKTTLCIQMCAHVALHLAVPVDFISLEMDAEELLFKLCAHMTGINGLKITGGALDKQETQLVEQAMLQIRKSSLRIYAPDDITASELVLYAQESVIERRTEVFCIDYVQLVSPEAGTERQSRYDQLGQLGRTLKMRIARAMDVSVLAVAQLNRDAVQMERPTSANMADSYDLARSADVVTILSGDLESEQISLWLDKSRHGTSGVLIPLTFDRPTQTFRESHKGEHRPVFAIDT